MKIHSKSFMLAFVFALVASFAAGCGGGDSASNFTQLPSDGSGGGGGGNVGAPVTTSYISLSVKAKTGVTTSLHKFNSFSSPCQIDSTSSKQDISCMLNMKELDLWFYGVTINENFPSNMCSYIREHPYWHYKAAPGVGPSSLSVDVNADSGTVTACTEGGVAGVVANGVCTTSEGYFDASGGFYCAYKYTDQLGNPVNCCSGGFVQLTRTTLTAGTITSTTPETEVGSHGGKHGNCMESPGIKLGFKTDADGLLRSKVYNVTDVVKDFAIPSAGDVGFYSSVYASNFYGWTDYAAGNHATAPLPVALDYNQDISGDDIESPLVPYIFDCLDTNFEVKHRIRLYINEWDTKEAFDAYHVSGDTSNLPTAAAADIEGVNCSVDSISGGFCDDFWGWDQFDANGNPFDGGPFPFE